MMSRCEDGVILLVVLGVVCEDPCCLFLVSKFVGVLHRPRPNVVCALSGSTYIVDGIDVCFVSGSDSTM